MRPSLQPSTPLNRNMNLRLRARGSSSRQLRRSANRPSYYEESSTDTETDNEQSTPPSSHSTSPTSPTAPPRRSLRSRPWKHTSMPAKPQSRRNVSAVHDDHFIAEARPIKKRRISILVSPRKTQKQEEVVLAAPDIRTISGVIPPWETLPYHIFVSIFTHASQPLYDNYFRPNSSIHWLLETATVSKSFYEPALAALYHSPPLMPQFRSHRLLQLLSTPGEDMGMNYKNKIQRLELEVVSGLITKGGQLGYFDLASLIKQTPQLKELHLYNWNDRVMNEPSMTRSRAGRWGYPKPIFDALDETKIRLRSFEWNGSFSEPKHLTDEMSRVHQRPSFQTLQDLTFVDFYLARQNSPSYQKLEESLGSSLAYLPNLRRLKFQNSSLVNEYLLPKLPGHLEHITFDNCDNLSSLNLRPFLASHGSQVKQLILEHNSSLNISFLTDLAESCPMLEVIKMDLHLFSTHLLTNDSEPRFDQLLLPSENPTWPSTLQILEFNQLRKWEPKAAEVFFGSLLDSGPELKALRRLVLKAIVNIGWRDRASFRETWIGRFERVFLRHSSPPDNSMKSLTPHHELKEGLEVKEKKRLQKRRSGRIAQREDEELKSTSFSVSPKRSLAGSQSNSFHSMVGSNTASPKRTREHSPEELEPLSVQGMCDVVTIRIDNLRPAESQLTEADFLDSEASGDEEWNGKDPKHTTKYAW